MQLLSCIALFFIMMYVIYTFNKLLNLNNKVNLSFAQIETLLKRRYDLIDNMLDILGEYIKHEKALFDDLSYARTKANSALLIINSQVSKSKNLINDFNAAEQLLINHLVSIDVAIEKYPDIKASRKFKDLSDQLIFTENLIAYSRASYNASVLDFNVYKQSFPQVVFSSVLGYTKDASPLSFK